MSTNQRPNEKMIMATPLNIIYPSSIKIERTFAPAKESRAHSGHNNETAVQKVSCFVSADATSCEFTPSAVCSQEAVFSWRPRDAVGWSMATPSNPKWCSGCSSNPCWRLSVMESSETGLAAEDAALGCC